MDWRNTCVLVGGWVRNQLGRNPGALCAWQFDTVDLEPETSSFTVKHFDAVAVVNHSTGVRGPLSVLVGA